MGKDDGRRLRLAVKYVRSGATGSVESTAFGMDHPAHKRGPAERSGRVVPAEPLRSACADLAHREVECLSAFGYLSGHLERELCSLLRPEVCATSRCGRDA